MINVRAEYPEGYEVLDENYNSIHIKSEVKKECGNEEELIKNCPNEEIEISALTSGVVSKIPVMLAALKVKINIDSSIEFSEPLFQIKEVINKINVHKCTLMYDTDILFIKGSIKKDIKYYTSTCCTDSGVCGEVQTLTINIPFKCSTLVKYNIMKPEKIIESTLKKFKCVKNHDYLSNYVTENEEIVYEDINQAIAEYYNEAPYCEIVSSEIVEAERLIESKTSVNNSVEQELEINAIEWEGTLYVTIWILQNRLVAIPIMS